MLAPFDARTALEVEGEAVTLRLNFAGIAMCEELGVDLFSADGVPQTMSRIALVVKGLAISEHPEMTADQALAIVAALGPVKVVEAVLALIGRFGAQAEETEGNVQTAKESVPTVN
ncbi:hypothetical protein [Novosphingobium gossypii]|uniref:hypothetical protein n=1 Tax=Novosphingobium gossypii TaxID=1604774 RepID=UPI003D1985D1